MLNNLSKKLLRTLFSIGLIAVIWGSAISVSAQKRTANSKPVKTNPPVSEKSETLASAPSNPLMTGVWESGALPQPLPLPPGNADEAAAILAQKVAAQTEESVPALLTALQLAGFFITNRDGSVFLAPIDNKGQGLAINGWEVAAAAKMYGDRKTTSLTDLNERLKSIPAMKNAEPANLLMQGVRAGAENSGNQFLRAWARFILELGKSSAAKNDASGNLTANAEETIDAIQHLLLFRRLHGDLYARQARYLMQANGFAIENQNYKTAKFPRFVGAAFSAAEVKSFSEIEKSETKNSSQDQSKIPCRMDGNAPIVMDASATLIGVGYGELMGYLENVFEDTPTGNALEKAGKVQALANIILAYAKFIQTYAALEVKLVLDDAPPLVRTKNAVAGERKNLHSEVRINIGNWQMYNCIRTALNVTAGIDFATLNDGPIGDVGVTWHLDQGGAGDFYSNGTGINPGGEQIVGFTQNGVRIQDKGATVGTKGNSIGSAVYGKTDNNGITRIMLEGSPQKNAKTYRAKPVMKQAVVRTTIKLKAGDIKSDTVDVAGQAISGAGGLITMPTELLYRVSWASSGTLTVPVKDWEDCTGGWTGTISVMTKYHKETQISPSGNLREANTIEDWTLKADYTLNGEQDRNGGFVNAYFADVRVGYTKSDYARNFYEKFATGCLGTIVTSSQTQTFERKSTASGNGRITVFVSTGGNSGSLTFNTVRAVGENSYSQVYKTACSVYDNINTKTKKGDVPFIFDVRGFSVGIDVDPRNPDVLSGTKTVRESDGSETTYTWNLAFCR